MKVIIISKNCYPILGPRAHRTTELAKEIAKRGHNVIVYALLGNYDYTDFSKKTNIAFNNLGESKFGIADNEGNFKRNFLIRVFRKLFGKLIEFPNIELIPMVKNVLKYEKDIDLLITIAQPHTIHWGAAKYTSKYKDVVKKWIADCGDPFMGNTFEPHPFYFEKMERKWCELADYITIPIEEAREAYYPEYKNKIKVIPQGFNFNEIQISDYVPNKIPTFAYSGVIYKDLRDPTLFLEYLIRLKINFKFIVYTKNHLFFEPYKKRLKDKLEIRDYIPREKLLIELSKMDFLVNIKNNSEVQQPSKLIDYAITERPILNISSSFKERQHFDEFIKYDFRNKLRIENVHRYNIVNVVDDFLKL